MKTLRTFVALCLAVVTCALPALAQGKDESGKNKKPVRSLFSPTPDDFFLPVTSIEWGMPDRFSLTARYIHMFDDASVRDHKPSLNNFTVTVIPGISGGRLGIGYENVYDFKKRTSHPVELAFLSEARVVALRTWGSPLVTQPNRTFIGGELRTSLGGVANISIGYYSPLANRSTGTAAFWGLHTGFGI